MPAGLLKILPFLRSLLPVNKIAAWIQGVVLVAVVGLLGASKEGTLAEMCGVKPDEKIVALEKEKEGLAKQLADALAEVELLKNKK